MKKLLKIMVMLMTVAMITVMLPQVAFGDTSADSTDTSDGITVYLTISNDGNFVQGKEGTVMARVPVKISYFDLKDYGLEKFYRLESDTYENGGKYLTGGKLIEKPTLLHLYLRALEKYYAGHTLSSADVHSDIINVTGSATSMYMKKFWGHDENLMYYVNHEYPLMCKGTGSTADYILLQDGMDVDLAMFTDWNFYKEGAFAYFDPESRSIETGDSVTLTMKATATNAAEDGESSFAGKPMPGETVRVSGDYGKTWQENYASTDSNGKVTLKFDKPGTYYISGGTDIKTGATENSNADNQGGTTEGTGYTLRTFKNYKFAAPPISVITVKEHAVTEKLHSPQLKLSSLTETSVKLTWNKVNGADSYLLYYRKGDSDSWDTKGTDGTSISFNGLKSSSHYEFKIKAIAGSRENTIDSDVSEELTATTGKLIKLGKVSKLKVKVYTKRAKLTWKYSGGNSTLSGYQVYVSDKKSSGFKKAVTVKSGKATVNKSSKKHKTYYFRVRGYKKVKDGYKYTKWTYVKGRR